MKEWKAPEKEAQKMTRDGAVSVNLVTSKTTYPSDRTPEQDHSASGDTAGAAGKVVDRAELHREQAAAKKKRRKQRRAYREGEAAASRPSSRLQFSEADRAVPELQGAIRKSDKAADQLDAAKAAVPSKPPSPQHTNPLSRPIHEAGAAIHGKVREVEQENSGVQSGPFCIRRHGGRRWKSGGPCGTAPGTGSSQKEAPETAQSLSGGRGGGKPPILPIAVFRGRPGGAGAARGHSQVG